MALNLETIRHLSNTSKRTRFDAWLQQPAIKFMLSMIPPTEPPEVAMTLLRAAFDDGHDAGEACVVHSLADEILSRRTEGP